MRYYPAQPLKYEVFSVGCISKQNERMLKKQEERRHGQHHVRIHHG